MKVYTTKSKNIGYLLYRIIRPVVDPIKVVQGIWGYLWFARDFFQYKLKSPSSKLFGISLFPVVDEKVSFTPFDAHYFYQQLWVFESVLKRKPKKHVDISSTYEMSGYLSKITKAVFIDYRPIKTSLKNLEIQRGDILNLKLETGSVESLSCLHTIEHIGLGRYGDPIDPLGTKKACAELARVLKKGGRLYLSAPIGREKICFNAHRIHAPQTIKNYLRKLNLVSFSVVDDEGEFHENIEYKEYAASNYACGMFLFTKQ